MRNLYFFALFLVLYELATYLSNDMIMPGMLQVIHEFNAAQGYVALSLSFYILGNCIFILPAGGLSERFGKRRIILIGNFLFLLFTLLVISSRSIHEFMLWRLLEGGGMAIIAIGYALIHENFNDKSAVKLTSLMGNISLIAPLAGPVFGSLIISYFSWRYIFVFTFVISTISLFGLFFYIPKQPKSNHTVNFGSSIKQYLIILKNKQFFQGTLCLSFISIPILLWIGQAPNLVLYKLHQDYLHYAIYQLISIGGMTISTLLMQFLAGKYKMYDLVNTGIILLIFGLIISAVGYSSIDVIVSGLFIYTLGLGLANGCLFRLVMSLEGLPSGLVATLLGFIQMLLFGLGIMLSNKISNYFDYSLLSFAMSTLFFGLIAYLLTKKYISFYHQREWQ